MSKIETNFTLPNQNNEDITLFDIKSSFTLIYFYPKDMTPGCTNQALLLKEAWEEINSLDCCILGISKDSSSKHKKFIDKYQLPFDLLADEETKVCQQYGTWQEKSMYGKKYMGIIRSSFLLNKDKEIIKSWEKVKIKEHVKNIIQEIEKNK